MCQALPKCRSINSLHSDFVPSKEPSGIDFLSQKSILPERHCADQSASGFPSAGRFRFSVSINTLHSRFINPSLVSLFSVGHPPPPHLITATELSGRHWERNTSKAKQEIYPRNSTKRYAVRLKRTERGLLREGRAHQGGLSGRG